MFFRHKNMFLRHENIFSPKKPVLLSFPKPCSSVYHPLASSYTSLTIGFFPFHFSLFT